MDLILVQVRLVVLRALLDILLMILCSVMLVPMEHTLAPVLLPVDHVSSAHSLEVLRLNVLPATLEVIHRIR